MTQFMIRPSYESTAASATYVVVLFSMYVLFVGYMASYDLAYVPNTGMLGDLLFGNNEQYEKFKLFVKQARDGFTPTREVEPEAGPARTSWFEDAAQHLQAYWYTFRRKNGDTVKVRSNA